MVPADMKELACRVGSSREEGVWMQPAAKRDRQRRRKFRGGDMDRN